MTVPWLLDRSGGAARPRTARGVALVLVFWWGATGLLLLLQRSGGTRLGALLLAACCGPLGLWLLVRARDALSERAVVRSFFGGALLWTCVSAAFYGGWVVGHPLELPATAPVLMRAADAILATIHSSILTALLLCAALWLTRGAPNRLGVATFVVFWAVHELAKLNVFLGVVNPGTQFLPSYLSHLQRYFGPAHNSPLLAISVMTLTAIAAMLGVRAWETRQPGRRLGATLLACVLLLAAFEHALLGTPRDLGWWNVFLSLRGTP